MRIFPVTVLSCCAFLIVPGATTAQPRRPPPQVGPSTQVLGKVTPEQVASALQQAGYRAQVVADSNGKHIDTAFRNMNTGVLFYNCDNQGCGSFQYLTGWTKDPSLSVEYANAWNAAYLFAKAYVDNDGNFVFVMDVNADGGITPKTIGQSALWFDNLLGELLKFHPNK